MKRCRLPVGFYLFLDILLKTQRERHKSFFQSYRMDRYVRNQDIHQIPYQSIPKRLKFLATETPKKTAFVFVSAADDTRICMTYDELFQKSESFGKGLKSLGFGQDDVIGIGDERSPETLVSIFGVQMTGAIPMLFRFSKENGEDIIDLGNAAKCTALIVDPGNQDDNWNILQNFVEHTSKDGTVISSKLRGVKKLIFMRKVRSDSDVLTMQDVINRKTNAHDSLPEIDPDSTAVLLLTSGSTGIPKMVPYTHFSILIEGFYSGIAFGTLGNEKSIVYNDLAFSWSGGFPAWVIFYGGCKMVIQNIEYVKKIPDVVTITSRIIQSENCTCAIFVAPFLHEMLVKESGGWFIDTIVATGQPIHSSLSKCVARLCNNFCIWYGSTEAGTAIYKHVNDPSTELDDYILGHPVPGVELRILSKDGQVVPVGDIGELYLRSPIRFPGYYNCDVTTKSPVSKSGWLRTHDLVHMSANGELVMDGRASEVMLIHGEVVLPSQLEKEISSHPGVHDVFVSPVPDPIAFQHACVSVVLKPGFKVSDEDFNTFLKDLRKVKENDPFGSLTSLYPKYYLYFDSYFPLTKNGKTDKKAIAAEALKRLKIRNHIRLPCE